MLQIIIEGAENWDQKKEEFIHEKDIVVQLEHSLVSISKWESKWCRGFLNKKERTTEETIDYIRCMIITQNINDDVIAKLLNNQKYINQIEKYIEAPMTASIIADDPNAKKSNEPITSELIYYWMISMSIPFECQKWHLNRLLTLIKICSVKNQPAKKVSKKEIMSRNAALNAKRKREMNTTG